MEDEESPIPLVIPLPNRTCSLEDLDVTQIELVQEGVDRAEWLIEHKLAVDLPTLLIVGSIMVIDPPKEIRLEVTMQPYKG